MQFVSLVHFRGFGAFECAHFDDGVQLRGERGAGECAANVPERHVAAADAEQYYGDPGDGSRSHAYVLRDAVHGPAGDTQADCGARPTVLRDAVL